MNLATVYLDEWVFSEKFYNYVALQDQIEGIQSNMYLLIPSSDLRGHRDVQLYSRQNITVEERDCCAVKTTLSFSVLTTTTLRLHVSKKSGIIILYYYQYHSISVILCIHV